MIQFKTCIKMIDFYERDVEKNEFTALESRDSILISINWSYKRRPRRKLQLNKLLLRGI
jgi:hypothetical protein